VFRKKIIIFCPNDYQRVKLFWGKKAKNFEKKKKKNEVVSKKKYFTYVFFFLEYGCFLI